MGGGSDSTLSDWMVETLETMLPQLIKAGVITEEIDIEALKANIAAEVQESHLQVVGPAQTAPGSGPKSRMLDNRRSQLPMARA